MAKAAYVVFRGRKPGVYRIWNEAEAQVKGFPKQKLLGFDTFFEAGQKWDEWQRKCAAIVAASAPQKAPENTARPWAESIHPPTPWVEPPTLQQIYNSANAADEGQAQTPLDRRLPALGVAGPLYPTLPPIYTAAADHSWNYDTQQRLVLQQNPNLAMPIHVGYDNPPSSPWQASLSQPSPFFYDPPQHVSPSVGLASAIKLAKDATYQSPPQSIPSSSPTIAYPKLPPIHGPSTTRAPPACIDLTEDSPSSSPAALVYLPNLKRPSSNMLLANELVTKKPKLEEAVRAQNSNRYPNSHAYEEEVVVKRVTNKALYDIPEYPGTLAEPACYAQPEFPALTVEDRYELDRLKETTAATRAPEKRIELSLEQEKVVNLALRKNNIFLTGAAGCGKTVTLKEILYRLGNKKKGGNVQVVAPTGIAALPLDGKTTYSFAGVSQVFW